MRQFEASRDFDCTPWLPEIHAPTLIVAGDLDRPAPLELAQRMHAGIAGPKPVTLHGRHLVLFTHPAPCIAAIQEFLETT